MNRRWVTGIGLAALLAAPARAQMGAGQSGGRGGRSGGSTRDSDQTSRKSGPAPADPADKPTSGIEITGVVKTIDQAGGRVTIYYDAVEELNWPRGTMPFPVAREELLTGLKVGERVRFKVESHQIYEITPY